MRILEVRDGFIKLEAQEKVSLSSFLQVNDTEKRYIAQVVQIKKSDDNQLVLAKILFVYDGVLKKYDKTLPNKSSEISEFTFDILSKTLEYDIPIVAGKFIDGSVDIPIDSTCFNKKMLISVDSPKVNNRIISNLTKQFTYLGKVVVIDMLGVIDCQKYTAGIDFRLPLNTESLNFMYEDCLNDATAESKSLIKEIFEELSEYSETVPFLPFDTLKNIVDDMVDKSHVFKLLVLKNKLAKFAQQGYFAATSKEAQNLEKILEENFVVIDLSKLDAIFQNRYLETIYSVLEHQNSKSQIFIEASNSLNKKNIKRILESETVASIFATHSKFKYINEIKTMFDNFIIEPSFTNNEIFKIYSSYLTSMPKDTYLLVGEGTNYIPLVSSLEAVINIPQKLEEPVVEEEEISNEVVEELEENSFEEDIVEEISVEDLDETAEIEADDFEEVTEAEEADSADDEVIEEIVPEINAEELIEQKADELINKMTEETEVQENSEEINVFEEEVSESEEHIEEPALEPIELEENNLQDDILEVSDVDEADELEISLELEPADVEEESVSNIEIETVEEFHTDVDEFQSIEIPEDISDLADDIELEVNDNEDSFAEESEPVELNEISDSLEQRLDIDADSIGFKEYSEEEYIETEELSQDVIPLSEEDSFEEIVELDESDIENLEEDAILVELDDAPEEFDEESLDRQIVEDVDKVFTTIKEEAISDSDLDFIDELNSEDEQELLEVSEESSFEELPSSFNEENLDEDFLEPIEEQEEISLEEDDDEILETRNTKTPIVPVYDADIPQEDMVMSDSIEQGDTVVHVKFGTGTVEKMIKYGTKTLFSINFDNVGRRLLDPTLTEIKKA